MIAVRVALIIVSVYQHTFPRISSLPEGGPPFIPCRRGTICRLDDLPCPFVVLGRSLSFSLPPSPIVLLSLAPREIIDTERLCPAFPFFIPLTDAPCHASGGLWDRAEFGGTFSDKVALWPMSEFGGWALGVVEPFFPSTLIAFLGLSPPSAKPFPAADEGCNEDRDGVDMAATFLKVISHSTSSPAKTVCSDHCTKTLILEDGVDIVDARPGLAHLRLKCRGYTRGSWAQRKQRQERNNGLHNG